MKRIIFTLLHADGAYMLSRNFRLQRVGDIDWVLTNYRIREVSLGIDELMILDVSRDATDRDRFRREVRMLVEECFVPVTVGGCITSLEEAARLFDVGADKVLLNTAFHVGPQLCAEVAGRFGAQALIAGIDVRRQPLEAGHPRASASIHPDALERHAERAVDIGAGEILLQSIDRDGTGNGLDMDIVNRTASLRVPLIVMGGVGHAAHIVEGLQHPAVDAVATANLFNFVGDSLVRTRSECRARGVAIADWGTLNVDAVAGLLKSQH
jgi:imidazole glycerol-phosphate synthase subunit HisF